MERVASAAWLPEGVTTPLLAPRDSRTVNLEPQDYNVTPVHLVSDAQKAVKESDGAPMVDGSTMREPSPAEVKSLNPLIDSAQDIEALPVRKDVETGQPQPSKDVAVVESKRSIPTPKAAPKKLSLGERAYAWWQWYTMYRQLCTIVVVANIIGLVLAATGKFELARNNTAQIAVVNTLVCVLVRNECFMRALYWAMVKSVTVGTSDGLGTLWAPVWYRNLITNFLLHIGGLHSGCGYTTLMWLIYNLVLMIKHNELYSLGIMISGIVLLAIVIVSCVTAVPKLRFFMHNHFEHGHRYAGWSAVAMVWVFIILNDSYDAVGRVYDVRGGRFYTRFQFFAAVFVTVLVVLPWLCVRKVPVVCEISPLRRIVLIKFPGYVQPGLYGRISRKELSEWHVFGCFSEHYTLDHHFMICSVVGGFTRGLAENPPTHLYVRTVKFAGYSYCHRMYEKGIAICTGAAIGVFISLFSQGLTNFDLIWVGSNFEETYGKTVIDMLKKGCPGDRLTLYDTKARRRPVLPELAAEQYHAKKAQVVFCVSNLEGTRGIVNGCRAKGIPAFGPIWDA